MEFLYIKRITHCRLCVEIEMNKYEPIKSNHDIETNYHSGISESWTIWIDWGILSLCAKNLQMWGAIDHVKDVLCMCQRNFSNYKLCRWSNWLICNPNFEVLPETAQVLLLGLQVECQKNSEIGNKLIESYIIQPLGHYSAYLSFLISLF